MKFRRFDAMDTSRIRAAQNKREQRGAFPVIALFTFLMLLSALADRITS